MHRSAFLGLALAVAACGGTDTPAGILLTIDSDFAVPKDLTQISAVVTRADGRTYTRGVSLDEVPRRGFSSTLSIVTGAFAGERVTVTVAGLRDSEPVVVRELAFDMPTDDKVTVPARLEWMCTNRFTRADDGLLKSDCGVGETCIAGQCHSNVVDLTAASLQAPAKSEACLDVSTCFASPLPAPIVDAVNCLVASPDAAASSINVGLELSDSPTMPGFCRDGRCIVPLDQTQDWDRVPGFRVVQDKDGARYLQLPPAVCDRSSAVFKNVKGIVISTACASKSNSRLNCAVGSE